MVKDTDCEFTSIESFHNFARDVKHGRRYVWSDDTRAFISAVNTTIGKRAKKLPQGFGLVRARIGVNKEERYDKEAGITFEVPVGLKPEEMKPKRNAAREGRANPAGMPLLYLANKIETALGEVRAGIDEEVSVAWFEIVEDLKVVDLTYGHGKFGIGECTFEELENREGIKPETKERAVWVDIDNAFSKPVSRSDEHGDYVPTQILAELFKENGFDGVVYRSQFGEEGYNVALFNQDHAIVKHCRPCKVKSIHIECCEIGN